MFQIPSLRQTPSLRTITTAHLTQTMALLELTAAELAQKVEAELAANPALELREEKRCPSCRRPVIAAGPCPRCTIPEVQSSEEPIVFVSPREDFHLPGAYTREDAPEDNFSPAIEELPVYVLRQIAPELAEDERQIAAHILTNLSDDGLLEVSLLEIARYHHVPIAKVEAVLRLIQRADPLGVGSPSPREALLVQLDVLSETQHVPPLAYKLIEVGMDYLSRHQHAELGRKLGVSQHQVEAAARFIGENLNPFPGRTSWGDIHQGKGATPNAYASPDILLNCLNNDEDSPIVVEIVAPYAGALQVNADFRKYASQASEDKASQWKSHLERADLLIKCMQQRTHTMVRLMKRLSVIQRQFILHGDGSLQPVTRASLAVELGVHESTISRAVAHKCIQLPSGHIVPLAKFFDRSLHIRTALKEIVQSETRPLSDTEIVKLLKRQGFKVARRTVAKYRAMEGILPSYLRQPRLSLKGS